MTLRFDEPPDTAHELIFPASSEDIFTTLIGDGDLATWINGLIDSPREHEDEERILNQSAKEGPPQQPSTDLAELDRKVARLATRINIASQDTSSKLEQSIDDISRTVPRLSYDLQFMRESALSLQSALLAIHEQSATSAADPETTKALNRLQFLDTVKARMESAREVLREAESWSTLEPEVIALLAENTYDKAAERLAEANKSMVVFQNTPEYEPRHALMVSLQNQLEAALSSALVAAINARDMASCRNYHTIFANIQRESEFRNYYYGSRRAAVVALWRDARLSDAVGEQDSVTSQKFSDFLSHFFADLLAVINEERTYTPAIFPEPQQAISVFIRSTIDALTPSFNQRLLGMLEYYGASALPELIKAFRATEEFAMSADKIVEKLAFSSMISPSTPFSHEGSKPVHSRRLSKRMSVSGSRRMGPSRASFSATVLPSATGLAWEQTLFEPFLDQQSDYFLYEKRYLDEALRQIIASARATSTSDVADLRARILRERSVDVFTVAEESLGRCMALTHGYGAVGLVNAVDQLFETFLEQSRADLLSPASSKGSIHVDTETLEELDYSSEDWTSFQLALHLLSACRSVRERLTTFESKLRSGLVHILHTFRLARGDPNGMYLSNTTRGQAQLLLQSTLNSADLAALLDSLEEHPMLPTPTVVTRPQHPGTPQLPIPKSTSEPLLRRSRTATTGFASACQRYLQKIILSPLYKHLVNYPSSAIWSQVNDPQKKSAFELNIPTFSLSPSQSIQRVAEGLLNLPRMIEVYASDDEALGFSIDTLPFINTESLRSLGVPLTPHEATGDDQHPLPRRRSSNTHLPPPSLAALPAMTADMVSSTWLSSLALSLLSHLTSDILPQIRSLSTSGAAQLASDLEYLSNIIQSFNVEWEDLEKWKEYVELSDADGKAKMSSPPVEQDDILNIVAKIRGW